MGATRSVPPQVERSLHILSCEDNNFFYAFLSLVPILFSLSQNTWVSAVVLYLANDVYNVMAVGGLMHVRFCRFWHSLHRISGNGIDPSMIVRTTSMRFRKGFGLGNTEIRITNGKPTVCAFSLSFSYLLFLSSRHYWDCWKCDDIFGEISRQCGVIKLASNYSQPWSNSSLYLFLTFSFSSL